MQVGVAGTALVKEVAPLRAAPHLCIFSPPGAPGSPPGKPLGGVKKHLWKDVKSICEFVVAAHVVEPVGEPAEPGLYRFTSSSWPRLQRRTARPASIPEREV